MNHFRFNSYLTTNVGVDEKLVHRLLAHCENKEVAKGAFLLQEGQKTKYSYFVERGLLRQYSIDSKGKEHIIQFAPESWFVSDRESEYFDQPSSYFIEAVERTTVFLINKNLIRELSLSDPNFMDFNYRLLHNHIRQLQKRVTQLQSATAEERYLDFIKIYPDMLLRVPQAMIASYLGIAPESLSRIRKDLADRHRGAS